VRHYNALRTLGRSKRRVGLKIWDLIVFCIPNVLSTEFFDSGFSYLFYVLSQIQHLWAFILFFPLNEVQTLLGLINLKIPKYKETKKG